MSSYTTGQAWRLIRQGRIFFGPAPKLVLLAMADRADQHGEGGYHVEELASQTGLSGGAVRDSLKYLEGERLLHVRLTEKRGIYRYRLTLDAQRADKLKSA